MYKLKSYEEVVQHSQNLPRYSVDNKDQYYKDPNGNLPRIIYTGFPLVGDTRIQIKIDKPSQESYEVLIGDTPLSYENDFIGLWDFMCDHLKGVDEVFASILTTYTQQYPNLPVKYPLIVSGYWSKEIIEEEFFVFYSVSLGGKELDVRNLFNAVSCPQYSIFNIYALGETVQLEVDFEEPELVKDVLYFQSTTGLDGIQHYLKGIMTPNMQGKMWLPSIEYLQDPNLFFKITL